MAQNTRTGDLTSGPMLQKIILFSLPLAASSILQLLFNAADVVVVGRFAGSTALAAVGSNGALINLLVNLFVGLSLGANVVAARCFGAKDDEGVRNTVQTSVTLGLVSGFLLAVVGFFAARVLRRQTQPGQFGKHADYRIDQQRAVQKQHASPVGSTQPHRSFPSSFCRAPPATARRAASIGLSPRLHLTAGRIV